MILFTLLRLPCYKSLLSLYMPVLVIYCWPAHAWQVCHMPGKKTENHCSKEIIHKSWFLVSYYSAGFSSNSGNRVYSTFLPVWPNLIWCLLGLRKPSPLEEGFLLRYLMLWSSRSGYTFYSATVFEQQAFIPALREFRIPLYGKNPISFLYWHSLWILCFTSKDHRECS